MRMFWSNGVDLQNQDELLISLGDVYTDLDRVFGNVFLS